MRRILAQEILIGILLSSSPPCRVGCLLLREWASPGLVVRGGSADLLCDYDLGNASLYSVRWFKDDLEFFRFVPRDTPRTKLIPAKGVTVDEGASTPDRLVLRGVDFDTSGQYRCEVSAEGPQFDTVTGTGNVIVVEPPSSGPEIRGGRRSYVLNETVELSCTSSPSRPPSSLSWTINGRKAPSGLVSEEAPVSRGDGLVTQVSRLAFVARPFHFRGGVLRVKCLAQILAGEEHKQEHEEQRQEHGRRRGGGGPKARHNTFRAWERSFQAASVGCRLLTPPPELFFVLFFVVFFSLFFAAR